MKIKKFITCVAIMAFLCPNIVLAESWWGKGTKPNKWILNHGGTLIYFDIVNYSGSKKEYKAVMYDKKGKYVEAEWGSEGLFDDAKDGAYTIKAKRGESFDYGVKANREEGKTFATIKFTAHPGETIRIKFDYRKRKAKMETNYVEPEKNETNKPLPVIESKQAITEIKKEENSEIKIVEENIKNDTVDDDNQFLEAAADLFHPDAMAKENTEEKVIETETAEKSVGNNIIETKTEKEKNIFEIIIESIVRWFRDI